MVKCALMETVGLGLRTLTLEVSLRATGLVRLPGWLGSTLHGALGAALHRTSCSRRCGATHAAGHRACAYSRLFEEPARTAGSEGQLRGMRPLPLVLRPPAPGAPRAVEAGEELRFGLVLIGRAAEDLGPVVAGLESMAERGLGKGRGGLALERIETAAVAVYLPQCSLRMPESDAARPTPADLTAVRVRSATPLRLYREGRPIRRPGLCDLVDAARRRHEALVALHGEPAIAAIALPVDAAASGVTKAAGEWRPFRAVRYSARQDRSHPMAGVVGEAIFEGAVEPYWPLLELATRVGVGKATSFGFGLLEIEPVRAGSLA